MYHTFVTGQLYSRQGNLLHRGSREPNINSGLCVCGQQGSYFMSCSCRLARALPLYWQATLQWCVATGVCV
jgi:hypothetical protein